jgi:hypothetical protein
MEKPEHQNSAIHQILVRHIFARRMRISPKFCIFVHHILTYTKPQNRDGGTAFA